MGEDSKGVKSLEHELSYFEECSLFNSGHEYADGFDRAVCSCGWKSASAKDRSALVIIWEVHQRNLTKEKGGD